MNNPLTPCGCPQNNSNEVCGEFTEPTNPDLGRCHPYRVKTSCEAPVVPSNECDADADIIYDPSRTPPFIIQAVLRDDDCEPILDEEGNEIITES